MTAQRKEHRVVREVRALVAQNPDFTYEIPFEENEDGEMVQGDSCLYIHNRRGSCGVGQALVRTGDLNPDRPYGKQGERLENNEAARVTELLGLRVPDLQQAWLNKFQEAQDDGGTWAEAERLADEYVYGEGSK